MIALSSDVLGGVAGVVVAIALAIAVWVISGNRGRKARLGSVVTVARLNSETEAAEWKIRLEQSGIRSATFGSGTSLQTGLADFFLQVGALDVHRAVQILRAEGCKGVV